MSFSINDFVFKIVAFGLSLGTVQKAIRLKQKHTESTNLHYYQFIGREAVLAGSLKKEKIHFTAFLPEGVIGYLSDVRLENQSVTNHWQLDFWSTARSD